MLTSHKLLQQYWHDDRYEIGNVRVWYIDRGAPHDRSSVSGPDISLEPYYMNIRTTGGEKPVPITGSCLLPMRGRSNSRTRRSRDWHLNSWQRTTGDSRSGLPGGRSSARQLKSPPGTTMMHATRFPTCRYWSGLHGEDEVPLPYNF